jgi:PKD repeat protein
MSVDRPRLFSRGTLLRVGLLFGAAATLARSVPAASYLPLPDAELARRAPVVLRARVVSSELKHESLDNDPDAVFTVTTLRALEVIKSPGASLRAGDVFRLELPGGQDDTAATWIPGTPAFSDGAEVVLFLAERRWRESDFVLTELGLSKFDVVLDRAGRTFAVRTVFSDAEDDAVSRRAVPEPPGRSLEVARTAARSLRDAGSFLASLRASAAGVESAPVLYGSPEGDVGPDVPAANAKRPLWVNIGGAEGSGALFRWYWDTGLSPAALVSATGTQSGLSDGSNGLSAVNNGAAAWAGVAGATLRYSTSTGSGPVVVHLDVMSQAPAWNDPLSCGSGGVIGYGGPGSSASAPAFKGSGGYYAPSSGNVWMRKVTGGCYSAATFRAAVLHELGHTLGLGHSDQGASSHSTTSPADWNAAVMHSVIPASNPSAPQADDIQAIQYYYGGGGSSVPAPVAGFIFSPGTLAAGQTASFTDASSGSPTSWLWSFGDGGTSTAQNPTRTFSQPGSYTVTLVASNAGGSGSTSRVVTVSPAAPPATNAPAPDFSFSPQDPTPGTAVQFNDASTGSPLSWLWNFGDPASGSANSSSLRNPTHYFLSAGTYTVSLTVSNGGGSTTATRSVTVGTCGGAGTALCLNGGRFRVTATWRVVSQGTSGAGNAVALTGDTGYFWFFTSNNVELVVKVVDGRAFNGRFWVFSGALSDVEYTLSVTDTVTGAVKTYTNPQGTLSSFSDAGAFASAEILPDSSVPAEGSGSAPGSGGGTTTIGAAGACPSTAGNLCLSAGRFRVQVAWQVASQGTAGSGTAVPLTADTGYFWFFSPNNVELVLKVVDGRAFNGHYWVFSGALSNVAYTITVTDTLTGVTKTYSNPAGSLKSFSDVSAF